MAHPDAEGFAFDQVYPGITGGSGCLSGGTDPVALTLAGGTVTVSAFDASGTPICPIRDSSTPPQVSDGYIVGGGMVVLEFEPPATAFYAMFGSVALGSAVTMTVTSGTDIIASTTSDASPHSGYAFGHGLASDRPFDRIEVTSSENGPAILGAFRFVVGGEQTLGSVTIPGHNGGYGVLDGADPLPTEPGVTSGYIEDDLRALCDLVDAFPVSSMDDKNNNAGTGRRNAMCNKLNAAAKAIAKGDVDDAVDGLTSLLQKLDGQPSPKDWMVPGGDRDLLRDALVLELSLIALL